MPDWEETKRQAQTAFSDFKSGTVAARDSVGKFYQQILTKGHISPLVGEADINRQIAEDAYDQRLDIDQQPEQYIEPER